MHDDILFGAQEIEKQVTPRPQHNDGEGQGESSSPMGGHASRCFGAVGALAGSDVFAAEMASPANAIHS